MGGYSLGRAARSYPTY